MSTLVDSEAETFVDSEGEEWFKCVNMRVQESVARMDAKAISFMLFLSPLMVFFPLLLMIAALASVLAAATQPKNQDCPI